VIAQKSDGGMRDALSVFDQMSAYSGGNITYKSVIANLNLLDYDYYFRLTDAFIEGDVPKALLIFDEILRNGFEAQYFVSGLSNHLRDLLICKDPETIPLLEVGEAVAKKYSEQATKCTNEFLYRAIDISSTCDFNYKVSSNKRLLVELSLIKISQLNQKKKSDQVDDLYWWEDYKLESIASDIPSTQGVKSTPVTTSTTPQQSTTQNRGQITVLNTSKEVKIRSVEDSFKRSKQLGTISISRSSVQEEVKVEKQTVIEEKSNSFTLDDLRKVWLEYTTTISTETILVNTMKSCNLQLLPNFRFKVEVSNADQMQRLLDRKSSLLPYLRNSLGNTYIDMEIEEAEIAVRRTIFSPLEKLNYMMQKNPNLMTICKDFDLEIK
jgi:DNA polymerase-3 subunit gamma/tau